VLRSGDRIRISVQLVQPDLEKRVRGKIYERDVRDVLTLQSEVARAIVEETRVNLTPGEQARLATARTTTQEARRLRKGPVLLVQKNGRRTSDGGRVFRAGDRDRPAVCTGVRRPCRFLGACRRRTHFRTQRQPSRGRWNSTPIWPRHIRLSHFSTSVTTGTGPPRNASSSAPLS
jgi:hypothetical protein